MGRRDNRRTGLTDSGLDSRRSSHDTTRIYSTLLFTTLLCSALRRGAILRGFSSPFLSSPLHFAFFIHLHPLIHNSQKYKADATGLAPEAVDISPHWFADTGGVSRSTI